MLIWPDLQIPNKQTVLGNEKRQVKLIYAASLKYSSSILNLGAVKAIEIGSLVLKRWIVYWTNCRRLNLTSNSFPSLIKISRWEGLSRRQAKSKSRFGSTLGTRSTSALVRNNSLTKSSHSRFSTKEGLFGNRGYGFSTMGGTENLG